MMRNSFTADVPAGSPNKRLAYVGQPLYQSGYSAATRWLKLVPKDSHVMLEIGVPGSLNTQPRLDGYIQAIKDQGNHVTYDVVNAGPDPATEISRIESYYLSHKKVAGLFATGGSDTYACGFVSAKYGLAKADVIVAGFDLFPQSLGYINTLGVREGANVLGLIQNLRRQRNVSIILIVHHYNQVFEVCDRINFLHSGEIVLDASTSDTTEEELIRIVKSGLGREAIAAAAAEVQRQLGKAEEDSGSI